jgi:hypothetical protein
MTPSIEVETWGNVDPELTAHLETWGSHVLTQAGISLRVHVSILVFDTLEALRRYQEKDQYALGVVTGDSSDFLATHDAWHGHPRILICQERVADLPQAVLRGVVQHEMAHAVLHGDMKFYQFRFSARLEEKARLKGMTPAMLHHLVYFISVAVKDLDVVHWLAEMGLHDGQIALLRHCLADTSEERAAWVQSIGRTALRTLVLAGILKTLLPVIGLEECQARASSLMDHWQRAYDWLSAGIQQKLVALAIQFAGHSSGSFQHRLDNATVAFLQSSF